jgi:hypothetical protein
MVWGSGWDLSPDVASGPAAASLSALRRRNRGGTNRHDRLMLAGPCELRQAFDWEIVGFGGAGREIELDMFWQGHCEGDKATPF